MTIIGKRKKTFNNVVSVDHLCPACAHLQHSAVGSAQYYHICSVPIVMFSKNVVLTCLNCNKETHQRDFIECKNNFAIGAKTDVVDALFPLWHTVGLSVVFYILVFTVSLSAVLNLLLWFGRWLLIA